MLRIWIKKGGTSSAHKLEAVIQQSSIPPKQEPNKPNYTPFIFGGILVMGLALIIGYWVGKQGKEVLE